MLPNNSTNVFVSGCLGCSCSCSQRLALNLLDDVAVAEEHMRHFSHGHIIQLLCLTLYTLHHYLHSFFCCRLLIHVSLLVHEHLIHVLSLAVTVCIGIDWSCLISGSGKMLVMT